MDKHSKIYLGRYEGAEPNQKRKSPGSYTRGVDQELDQRKRRVAIENARDLDKNFAIAAWAIRKHLDYVSSFNFEPQTGDANVDRQLSELMAEYSQPENCHVARRHGLADVVRLAEAARTVDGDVLLVKLSSGHLQAIESDRIENPPNAQNLTTPDKDPEWVNGVRIAKGGKARAYSIYRRSEWSGREWERNVAAENVFHHGYFQRFDQVRGVSPLMSALNSFRDTYEGLGYAIAKAKVTQLFGLVINSAGSDSFGNHTANGDGTFKVDFGEGPFKMELEQDESASILESNSPPMELQQFLNSTIAIAIKALDLPFSFYDESFTNFNGSRIAGIHYAKACEPKVAQNQKLLDGITRWRLAGYFLAGRLTLPRGWTLDNLSWEWIPKGSDWWNPLQEVQSHELALKLGITTRQQIVKERLGKDWETDILPQIQREDELLLQSRGFLFDPTESEPMEPFDDDE